MKEKVGLALFLLITSFRPFSSCMVAGFDAALGRSTTRFRFPSMRYFSSTRFRSAAVTRSSFFRYFGVKWGSPAMVS